MQVSVRPTAMRFGAVPVGLGLLVAAMGTVGNVPGAAAATAGVAFANARFSGYASATEVHLGAVTAGTTTLAEADQAFSGASTSTSGLTTAIRSETGVAVQPVLGPSVHSYGRASGLELGAGTSTVAAGDPNQVTLAGLAEAEAPPNGPARSKSIGPLSLPPVASASLVDGKAAATWFPASCPIGQPLSYGTGDLAGARLLDLPTQTSPLVATGGSGVSSTSSYDFLSPNGDGTFGLSSIGEETVAPATVSLLNLVTVKITVAGANPSTPIDLLARTTGGPTGSQVKLLNGGLVTVTLQAAGAAPVTVEQVNLANPSTLGPDGFLHVALSTSQLGSSLTSLSDAIAAVINGTVPPAASPIGNLFGPGGPLNGLIGQTGLTASVIASKLADVSLGSVDIDAVPHAIGGPVTSPPTLVGGTQAAGAIDLVHAQLGLDIRSALGVSLPGSALSSIRIADLRIGHLEAAATDAAPIACTLPVIKTADPASLDAGQSFTYHISVPDPAYVDTIACNLTDMKVVDSISDAPGHGNPTFHVASANDGGVIDQTSPTTATVTWTGLSYTAGSPPLGLDIGVSVPADSPAGTISDTVTATATTAGCTGGTSGLADIGANAALGINGTSLTGSYTLPQPTVSTVAVPPPAGLAAASSDTPAPRTLPFTGAMGGLWQPFAGLGALALGGGTLALVRRSRRIRRD